jgi:predicted DsbA family dithiol-disulfide isomerase
MDRAAYMTAKFGDPARIEGAHRRLAAIGAEAGITYDVNRILRSPNTLDAHRVIRWAEPEGLQTRTAMALFRRYFERGEDISDPGVLRAAAEEAGLDGAVVAALLAGDADRTEVLAEAEAARELGVTGVPTFLIAGQYVLTGAQPVEVWDDVIGQLEAATAGV